MLNYLSRIIKTDDRIQYQGPEMKTVCDVFESNFPHYAERPFIHIPLNAAQSYHDTAIDYNYAETQREIKFLQDLYHTAGFGLGHRVGLLLDNRAEFFFHWLALNALGVSIVPLNGEFSAEEMAYVISHSEVDSVVCLPKNKIQVKSAIAYFNGLVPVVASDEMATLQPPIKPKKAGNPDTGTECAMLYTSGSTGKPKGCILTNEYFIVFGEWYRDVGGLCALKPGEERLLTPLPLVHMNALACSTMG